MSPRRQACHTRHRDGHGAAMAELVTLVMVDGPDRRLLFAAASGFMGEVYGQPAGRPAEFSAALRELLG